MHPRRAILLTAVALAVLAFAQPVRAQSLQPIGPVVAHTCDCHTLIAPAAQSDLIYAAGDGDGVFRSEDGGDQWADVSDGLPSRRIVTLAVAPAQPQTLYAAIDLAVWRSDDGGAAWRQTVDFIVLGNENYQFTSITRLIPHPANAEIVFATVQSFSFIGESTQLARSTDGGETWDVLRDTHQEEIQAISFRPGDAPALVISVSNDPATVLQQSSDLGDTWSAIGAGLNGVTIRSIHFVDARTGYLTARYGRGVYRTDDGGESWNAINQGLDNTLMDALIPLDAETAIAAAAGGALYRYANETGEWAEILSRDDAPFNAVDVLTTNDATGALLAATDTGIWRSADQGASWENAGSGLMHRSMAVNDAAPITNMILTATDEGLFRLDEEMRWIQIDLPTNADDGAEDAAVNAVATVASDLLFAGTRNHLYRSDDGGATWTEASDGIAPPVLPGASRKEQATGLALTKLVVLQQTSDDTRQDIIVGTEQGLFVSNDYGESWRSVSELVELTNWPLYPEVKTLVRDPLNADRVYATVWLQLGSSPPEFKVFTSEDRGAAWHDRDDIYPGLPALNAVVPDITQPDHLYLATQDGIWYSEDGGRNAWLLGLYDRNVLHMAMVPGEPEALVALSSLYGHIEVADKLQLSLNGGEKWITLDTGIDDLGFTGLFTTPDRKNTVFIGTRDGGLYRMQLNIQKIYMPIMRK
ncbi:MAG: hypothetical protein H6642_12620 [Caldilineaceae bacterium]|nr:hypothetical protein [Caldilineaceae bacterium]